MDKSQVTQKKKKVFPTEEFSVKKKKIHWSPPGECFVELFDDSWSPADLLAHLSAWPLVLLSPLTSHLYRLARGQLSSRKGIPSTVRAAVFVLPNSIPFHSPSAHSVYFCALLHRGAWLSRGTKTSPRLPIRWHDRWKQLPLAQQKEDKRAIFPLTCHAPNDISN